MRRTLPLIAFALTAALFATAAQAQFPGSGGPGGGKGGFKFGGGGFTAEDSFKRLLQQTGGTDTVDFSKLSPESRDRNLKMSQMMGTTPYPTSGVMNFQQYSEYFNRNAETMKAKMAAGPGAPGAPGGFGTPPALGTPPVAISPPGTTSGSDMNRRERDRGEKDRDRGRDSQGGPPPWAGGGGGPGGGWNGGGPGGWNGGGQGWPPREERRETPKEEEDAPKPVVYRAGKLPKEVPSWFEELDTDADGQIGLYEWRKASRATADFVEMDLNGDGLLTAEEWIRHSRLALEKKPDVASEDGESTTSKTSTKESKDDRRKKDTGKTNPFSRR